MATLHYVGIAERAGNGWSISFPSFPGVVSAADTFPALMLHAKDALATIVEAMQDAGDPLPLSVEQDEGGIGEDLAGYVDPRSILLGVEASAVSVRLNISMDDTLLARVDGLSRRQGASRSAILSRGARMLLDAEKREMLA